VDLTPRTGPESAVASAARTRPQSSRGRKIGVSVVLALVLAAGAIVLFQGLSNATMYFYNADEAVAKRAELEDDRFRLQGEVVPGTIREEGDLVAFDVRFNGVTVAVQHEGSPPDLFQEGIPVVLEGRWARETFASDRILVKHTSEYKAENPDRVPADAP
jgi:cytochrome c-type biogenesis protein CcmE